MNPFPPPAGSQSFSTKPLAIPDGQQQYGTKPAPYVQNTAQASQGDDGYASYYNSLPASTRAYMHAPGSPGLAAANAQTAASNAAFSSAGITDPWDYALGKKFPATPATPAAPATKMAPMAYSAPPAAPATPSAQTAPAATAPATPAASPQGGVDALRAGGLPPESPQMLQDMRYQIGSGMGGKEPSATDLSLRLPPGMSIQDWDAQQLGQNPFGGGMGGGARFTRPSLYRSGRDRIIDELMNRFGPRR